MFRRSKKRDKWVPLTEEDVIRVAKAELTRLYRLRKTLEEYAPESTLSIQTQLAVAHPDQYDELLAGLRHREHLQAIKKAQHEWSGWLASPSWYVDACNSAVFSELYRKQWLKAAAQAS